MALRDHPAGPWGQQDGLELVDSRILLDFGMILVHVYVSFWVSEYLEIRFLCGLVSRSSFYSLGPPKFGTSKSWFSHGKYCENRFFMEIVSNEFRDRFLLFFLTSSITVFLIFLALGTGLKTQRFLVIITESEFGIW